MRRLVSVLTAILLGILVPSVVYAQASIAGIVKDASGAVLPGVTVEAASPVLIEKVRAAVTDGSGQYRIVDLRPGTYTVTFSLTGFSSVKREGVELTGTFVATINADLKVGALEETITVVAESPIVDVQSVRRQTTLTNEMLTTVPNARSWFAVASLFQGVTIQAGTSSDIQVTPQMTVFGGAGGRANEGRMQVDGLGTGAALNGGGVSTYVADISNAQEVVTTNSGGLGEAEVGGPALNIVPKSGGNTIKGQIYLSGVPSSFVSSNYTEELRLAGLATPGKLIKQWDETFGMGGPIKRDRLWYYATYRDEGQHRTIPGIFPNLNAGDPTKWEYSPDTSREARGAESFQLASVRFTVQATQRNKFNVHWDWQWPCNGASFETGDACREQSDGVCRRAARARRPVGDHVTGNIRIPAHAVQNRQVTWQSPVTNKLLLEAGLGSYIAAWGPFEAPGNLTRGLVRVTELQARNGAVANFNYRSANWAENWDNPNRWRTSASYVTGAHSMKFGYERQLSRGGHREPRERSQPRVSVQRRPALPVDREPSGVQAEGPRENRCAVRAGSVDAADEWTLQGALRFDNARSYSPEQTIGPALINGQTFLSTPLSFPRTDGVNFKDLSPRGGLALDVFGNGKTALKVNFGKYMDPASNLNGNYSISNPIARIATTASRTWTDNGTGGPGTPGFGDFIPQCDLTNNALNGECAATTQTTFGTSALTTAAIDPNLLTGWGVRPRDWQIGVSGTATSAAPRVRGDWLLEAVAPELHVHR